MWESHRLGWI